MQFLRNKRIIVTGGKGFFGRAIIKRMRDYKLDADNEIVSLGRKDFDLTDKTSALLALDGADVVINLAANVGGIGYNKNHPANLFLDNILIGINVIESARINHVEKLVQVGTVCSYPKIPPHIPFREVDLWQGYPEEATAPYGIAKKSLFTMGEAYRVQYNLNVINLLLVNIYGPGDYEDEQNSHVIPAMIKKFYDAKQSGSRNVTLWGSGNATREFIYIQDAADGVIKAIEGYNETSPMNIGTGKEITIKQLAEKIASIIGYDGKVIWDNRMPEGQPRRVLDISLAKEKIGFNPQVDFDKGLKIVIEEYLKTKEEKKGLIGS